MYVPYIGMIGEPNITLEVERGRSIVLIPKIVHTLKCSANEVTFYESLTGNCREGSQGWQGVCEAAAESEQGEVSGPTCEEHCQTQWS